LFWYVGMDTFASMRHRFSAALLPTLAGLTLGLAPAAPAAQAPVPTPGNVLSGKIKFPRAQGMTLSVDVQDPSRATAALGFDGKCKGGGIGEFWAAFVPARETLRIRNGRFTAHLTGVARHVGGMTGRTGSFKWRLRGHFTDANAATALVSGTAVLRSGGHTVSRCKIARPAAVRLTLG
jgi:hypothetical protein